MVAVPPALLDTDTLSEVMKRRDDRVRRCARAYLAAHGHFTFSVITRYEILRGLKAKDAIKQLAAFEERCRLSEVVPLTDPIVVRAASIYADLRQNGQVIGDADILIAATSLAHGLILITNNTAHFQRVPGLQLESWKT